MTEVLIKIIEENPEILLFLSLAVGYLIGKIKIKGFGISTTASVLLTAMVMGSIIINIM